MPLLPRLTSFFRNRINRHRVERELDDELESYVKLLADEKMRDGVEPRRARRQAWMEIGGKESVKERVRERRIGYAFDTFFQDVSHGVRMLVGRPGFTLLAAGTLALGIGATTAVYAVVDGVLLRSLPYPEPDRLVFVTATARDGRQNFSPPDFVELREQSRSFEELGALVGKSVAPLIAVFVPRLAGPEYGGPQADDYTRFLIEELLPHVDRHYLTDGERRAIMGPGSAGVAAVYAAFQHPEVFQKAATQSLYPIPPTQDRLPEMIAAAETRPEHVYVVWSRRDYDLDPARRAEDASKALVEQLRSAKVKVTEHIADYSPGWGGWRGQDDEILTALFPHPDESKE